MGQHCDYLLRGEGSFGGAAQARQRRDPAGAPPSRLHIDVDAVAKWRMSRARCALGCRPTACSPVRLADRPGPRFGQAWAPPMACCEHLCRRHRAFCPRGPLGQSPLGQFPALSSTHGHARWALSPLSSAFYVAQCFLFGAGAPQARALLHPDRGRIPSQRCCLCCTLFVDTVPLLCVGIADSALCCRCLGATVGPGGWTVPLRRRGPSLTRRSPPQRSIPSAASSRS